MNSLSQINFKDKVALIRVDFNVSLTSKGKVADSTRIDLSLPTINYIIEHGGTPVIITHFGRPGGKRTKEDALDAIADYLEKSLEKEVLYVEDTDPELLEAAIENAKTEGQIVLFENLRFFPGEEKNDPDFAKFFAEFADVYVNEAFSASHRAHASIVGIPKLVNETCIGLLFAKEIKAIKSVIDKNKTPMTLILGGAKIDTKAGLIKRFIGKCDNFLIGGALANTFLEASGYDIGLSKSEKDKVELAQETMLAIEKEKEKILIPVDAIVCDEAHENAFCADLKVDSIEGNMKILDIGKETVEQFINVINQSKTIIWNGPVGYFEIKKFAGATKLIAEAIAKRKDAQTLIGGGDTVDALKKLGIDFSEFTHVSTAGGAMIEYVEKGTLPGIAAL
ncbi:MAG: phosphoglycerate kinase [Candidatus Gracilibacteria bacterium]